MVTVRGRTGGVLLVKPIVSEAVEHLGTALTSMVSEEVRQQVRFVAFRQPFGALVDNLKGEHIPKTWRLYTSTLCTWPLSTRLPSGGN